MFTYLKHLLITLCIVLGASSASHAFDRVVIDAGHGAHDVGGSYGYIYEKHLALDTARRLEIILNRRGIRTVMTRERDTYPSLEQRAKIGNRYRNSIFVSIHYNQTWRSSARGLETFYYHGASYPLARYIQSYTQKRTKTTDRGVKKNSFKVIKDTYKNPAVLVECGFVSNSIERKRMLTGAYRQMLAEGIARGILEYREAYH